MRELRHVAGGDARAPAELSRLLRVGKLKLLQRRLLRRHDWKTFVWHLPARGFPATAQRQVPCVKRCDIVHILVAPGPSRLNRRARASALVTLLHALDQTQRGVGS